MDLGLNGRTAAVAAASDGLGLATARALVAEGVRVAICGRRDDMVRDAVARLGNNAVGFVCDVSTPEGGHRFVQESRDRLGSVDILVANGGGPPAGTFESTPEDEYPRALDNNLLSIVAMCHEAVPAMRECKWGRVLAITSYSVRQPVPNLILSNTARAGVTAFLKTLSREVAADGVTVNTIQPGSHLTKRITSLHGGAPDVSKMGIPTMTIGDPDDFGAIAAFMCSEHAKFMTGVNLNVDGGATAGLP